MKQRNSLHVEANLQKLEAGQKILGWAKSKVGVVNLVSGL